MRIEAINHFSPHLNAVKALGKASAQTLGFFPEGAFEAYASRRGILVALDPDDHCLGYLLYRESRGHALIVHLCVAVAVRGQGVARHLLDHLCHVTRHLRGIRAECRRDFPADKMWPRLGFYALGERPGRAKEGSTLTIWRLDHGNPDLFTSMAAEQLESKLLAAIDANIFFDLVDPTRPNREEAEALQADWLQAELELAVSDELWNEINRGHDEAQRRRSRADASRITRFQASRGAFDLAYQQLRPLFPALLSPNDESDLRHVARAVAAEIRFFVTRDSGILERADALYTLVGISILRPSDLIVHLDELRREAAYQPARLAGTLMELRRVQSLEQASLASYFQADQVESRTDFERRLRRHLVALQTSHCLVALDEARTPLALMVYDTAITDVLNVTLFRVRKGLINTTLIRYGLRDALIRAMQEQRRVVLVTDPYLDQPSILALQEDGFVRGQTGWVKLTLAIADTASSLARHLNELGVVHQDIRPRLDQLVTVLSTSDAAQDVTLMAAVEHSLWPAKVIDAAIPTFLVPIQPRWAQELFDTELANQTLFGSLKRLTLNREGIYYRAHRPKVLTAPGRILWYVSQDKTQRIQGTAAIRACSRLDEVVIGPPKALYRQFRRLGIYEWRHVLDAAGGNLEQPIMAVRFSNTELFSDPISLNELRLAYKTFGKNPMLQGASHLHPPELFAELYRRGTRSRQGED